METGYEKMAAILFTELNAFQKMPWEVCNSGATNQPPMQTALTTPLSKHCIELLDDKRLINKTI